MEQLRKFAEQNPDLVVVRQSTRYPELQVVKYHRRVFYKGLWTPELCEMRGLVVDHDWNPVVRPFTKVFNRGECGTDIPLDEKVTAVRKINGFMGAYTRTEEHGDLVSTTGSLDSEYVDMAWDNLAWLKGKLLPPEVTLLWEIVDVRDPHIVPEQAGCWLIGARDVRNGAVYTETELDQLADQLGDRALRPEWEIDEFGEILERARTAQHEGYMVYGETTALKLKSPFYLVNKLFARINPNKVTEGWLREYRKSADEEFYPLLDHLEANLDEFLPLDEQSRLDFMRDFLYR